jgi:1-acyl-sn-glycerol-3-phosphate acyltransferase
VPLRVALRLAGVRSLPLGLTGVGGELDYLRHNWTISGARIERELGFVPQTTSAAAVLAAFGNASAVAPEPDDFGLDPGYIARYERTLFRFLHDLYWRIEIQGIENVPREGRAVLTGVHRGFMPWDGVMALVAVHRATGRIPRFLIHPCLVKPPFLANYMTKLGGIVANQENADWVLREGLLGMFPEGIHGAFRMYRNVYKLGKLGRDEYVKMALRNRAPIVPFVTVGSAEIYPIWGRLDWKWVKRQTEWLFLPLGPNFPFPGLPLPSKWHTRFLEPIPVQEKYGPEAAEDPAIVRQISREVRALMQAAIDDMLARRKSIFRGSIFKGTPGSPGRR